MKPFTRKELEALQPGDWVWIVSLEDGWTGYAKLKKYYNALIRKKDIIFDNEDFAPNLKSPFYGKTWLAYKNKEQAETEGEWVKLPCKVGDTVYCLIAKGTLGTLFTTGCAFARKVTRILYDGERFEINCARPRFVDSMEDDCNFYGYWNDTVFATKEEAEARLKELRGEK